MASCPHYQNAMDMHPQKGGIHGVFKYRKSPPNPSGDSLCKANIHLNAGACVSPVANAFGPGLDMEKYIFAA